MVPYANHHLRTSPSCPETSSQVVDDAITTTTATSFSQDSSPSYMSCIRQKLQVRGFSPETIKIIESSWRSGTKSQYQSVARKWFEFCNLHNCDYVTAPVSIALDFLSDLFASGLSYSYINTARSCLSSLLLYEDSSVPFGQLPLVKRFMKGIFELRSSFPRYTISWSISTVFDFIRATPLYTLSLKDLS